jgi:hypothetical protein
LYDCDTDCHRFFFLTALPQRRGSPRRDCRNSPWRSRDVVGLFISIAVMNEIGLLLSSAVSGALGSFQG